jgi:hypothetical protein
MHHPPIADKKANPSTTGSFTVAKYGSGSGVLTNTPGPAARGANDFAGGPTNAQSSARQDIPVSSLAADIDADSVTCQADGWLGGWLASQTIGSAHVSDRASVSGLFFRSGSGPVPAGTRKIRCSLLMTWVAGSYNDALADNLSLTLSFASPVLGIAISNDSAIISWSSETSDWTLQAATDLLLTGIWQNIAQPYSSTGGVFSKEVTGISATPRQFFRLVK